MKKIKLKLITVFAAVCFTFAPAFAVTEHNDDDEKLFKPPVIKDGIELSVYECAAAAFQNSPKIRRAKYNLDIAKHNKGIAQSAYFPVISAGAGYYNENNSSDVYHNIHYRELPNAAIAINQLIYNFGKTSALVKMEEFNKIAAEYEFMDSICEALFDIKIKYYNLLRAKALLSSAEDSAVKINEYFVKISAAGIDKQTAEANLKAAGIMLLEARNNYENARTDLANAMFLDKDYDFTIKNTPSFNYDKDLEFFKPSPDIKEFTPVKFGFTKENAAETAYKNSPDLRILAAVKKSMEQQLKYMKRTYLPDLTGTVGYEFTNAKEHGERNAANNGLKIGVNLSAEANIKEIYHGIKSADAQLKSADNEIDLFKQDLYFEIKRAFNNIEKSEKEIKTAKKYAELEFSNLKTVIEKYKQKKIHYTALQDAGKDFIKAEESYIEALYHYNTSVIQLEEAMHVHIADIHHKSEHAMRHHANELLEHLNEALSCRENEKGRNRHQELEEDL